MRTTPVPAPWGWGRRRRRFGDPRDLDLPIPVDHLLAIATDPRVDLTTSQAALDAGAGLDFWRD